MCDSCTPFEVYRETQRATQINPKQAKRCIRAINNNITKFALTFAKKDTLLYNIDLLSKTNLIFERAELLR